MTARSGPSRDPVRVLLTGAGGQLGRALAASVPASVALHACTSGELDVRDEPAVERAVRDLRPHVLLNAAAFTGVDAAESQEDEARAVNATGAANLARHAHAAGARLVHCSTDYVFDGQASRPYEPEDDAAPINAYGRTKLEGERLVLAMHPDAAVVRTAWLHSGHAPNFVATTVARLRNGTSMQVVDDQYGTPTRAAHLAEAIWRIAARPAIRGLLHFTDAGVASWYDVAACIHDTLRRDGVLAGDATVQPVPTARAPRPAVRPAYAVLAKHGTWARLDWTPGHWSTGVIASVRELVHA